MTNPENKKIHAPATLTAICIIAIIVFMIWAILNSRKTDAVMLKAAQVNLKNAELIHQQLKSKIEHGNSRDN
jgi:hypothetical protein